MELARSIKLKLNAITGFINLFVGLALLGYSYPLIRNLFGLPIYHNILPIVSMILGVFTSVLGIILLSLES